MAILTVRPFFVIRYLYGLEAGEYAHNYIDYADMVLNWDTNIAAVPPTLLVYNDAEGEIVSISNEFEFTLDYHKETVQVMRGVRGFCSNFDLGRFVDGAQSQYFIENWHRIVSTLQQELEEELIPEFVTLKMEATVSNISDVNVPSLSPTDINDLLLFWNISEYEDLLTYSWKFLNQTIGLTETVAKNAVLEAYNFILSDNVSGYLIGENLDDFIRTLVPSESFWSYNLQPNTIFGDLPSTLIPIDSPKAYAASSYTPSSMTMISGGGFVIPNDGIYNIQLTMRIEEDSIFAGERKTTVLIDINGILEEISSGHYIISSGDYSLINVNQSFPLDNGDNVKVYLHSTDDPLETLIQISGSINITKEK